MRASRLGRCAGIAAIILWSLAPIAVGLLTSVSTQRDVQAVPARWLPSHANLDAYRALLGGTASATAGGTVSESGTFLHAL